MEWHKLFPKDREPTMEEITDYIGGEAKTLWLSLMDYFDCVYKAKPKLMYSGCGMKPGWNVKFQKSGQAFGTLYPMENGFDIMIILAYRLDLAMEAILPLLSESSAALYREAGDYMKLGKWMMLHVDSPEVLEDYKKIIAVKLPVKRTK